MKAKGFTHCVLVSFSPNKHLSQVTDEKKKAPRLGRPQSKTARAPQARPPDEAGIWHRKGVQGRRFTQQPGARGRDSTESPFTTKPLKRTVIYRHVPRDPSFAHRHHNRILFSVSQYHNWWLWNSATDMGFGAISYLSHYIV